MLLRCLCDEEKGENGEKSAKRRWSVCSSKIGRERLVWVYDFDDESIDIGQDRTSASLGIL